MTLTREPAITDTANTYVLNNTKMTTASSKLRRSSRFALVLLISTIISACGGDDTPLQMPPIPVEIIVAESKPSPNVIQFPGRVQAIRTAEVRARVTGIVERRLYNEGVDVKEGQVLFQIDPRELRAKLNGVNASLARAEATVANAAQDVARFKGLVADQAISEQEYDAAVARLRTAEADVAQFKAQQESAELNLSFATVAAPIQGRAGRAQVTEGALVSASSATLMTTIEQLDPVYVNFSQSSSDVLRARREIALGILEVPELERITVELILEDGRQYNQTGHLDFFNFAVDPATGTVAVRAEFPNSDQILVPGQFVQARILAGVRPDSILIPQRAVQLTPQGATLLIVGEGDVVETRAITLGELYQGAWRVTEGLKPGERVIVEGVQKVRPGQTVSPQPYHHASSSSESSEPEQNTAPEADTQDVGASTDLNSTDVTDSENLAEVVETNDAPAPNADSSTDQADVSEETVSGDTVNPNTAEGEQ
ncbi:efflux RND transporter periplasmic adaptor subunit [Arenicella xantha]|uniref:Membrane fusion protein (Multidrug efflux system) n=1 Tax=Arenicella xantha TaxID=644221 RepID=A0A395JIN1_9GAMM|nr:efflux RND transporter periplasmic adaptor subunit [Arenicella xantha]RBP50636.1 membrane fusion protein (multidrug efflux system) [Arenicella xantha]